MVEDKKPSALSTVGKDLIKAFNTGVSYFIPIVVIGGVFLAFSLATGTAGKDGIEVTNPVMQSLNLIARAGIIILMPATCVMRLLNEVPSSLCVLIALERRQRQTSSGTPSEKSSISSSPLS